MFNDALTEQLKKHPTPFFYYDLELLKKTLEEVKAQSERFGYIVHYAVKANANERILRIIHEYGLGADCVSGNEVKQAINSGFPPEEVVFAGVGKSDEEIELALGYNIFCFNCESLQEIEVLNELAGKVDKKARIALRINPNVDAHTHKYITTGLEENKFGINMWEMEKVLETIGNSENIDLIGLHFHIGSQITDLNAFKELCVRVNEIQEWFYDRQIIVDHVNVGGGLGVDYHEPDKHAVADFKTFFELFDRFLELRPRQKLHFELGRVIVAQCSSLIGKVLYIKNGINTNFAILDAGMTELIRPALYQAYHKIENLTGKGPETKYDVVGPICESSDCFGKAIYLPEAKRGDLFAIRSAGAYGQIMSSDYNLRVRAKAVYSDEV